MVENTAKTWIESTTWWEWLKVWTLSAVNWITSGVSVLISLEDIKAKISLTNREIVRVIWELIENYSESEDFLSGDDILKKQKWWMLILILYLKYGLK